MSTADPPDDAPHVRRDGAGRLYAQADELPDLPAVLAHAHLLADLHVTSTAEDAGVAGRARGWTLGFTCQGHAFAIRTDYHAGVTVYSAADPGCPEPLFRGVVAHFDGMGPAVPTWVPPPPLTGRRLLLLFLAALAVAAPLVVFLVLFRKP